MKSINGKQHPDSKPTHHDQIRDHIIAAAEKLYKKTGFNSISMGGLAEEMSISKKTIYQCFINKAELVDCIVSKQIANKKKELEDRKRLAENPIQEAFIAWHIIDEFVQDFNIYTQVQFKKSFLQTFKKIISFKNDFLFKLFKSNVDRGITEGLYRGAINSGIISRYMVEISFMSYNSKVFSHARFSSMEIDNQLLTYHLYGLATEKGVSLIRAYKNEALAHSSKYMDFVYDGTN